MTSAPTLEKDPVRYWFLQLEREKKDKAHGEFRKQAKESAKAARDDDQKKHNFNIHWANCRILRSAIYANRPKPDVRRRYTRSNNQQIPPEVYREEKELARLVERAIEYQLDTNEFEAPSKAVVKDFVETSLGVPRVVYDVRTAPIELPEGVGELLVGDDGEPMEEIVSQSVYLEHLPWERFHWEPGKNEWRDIDWISIDIFKDRQEAEKEYDVAIKQAGGEKTGEGENKDSDEILIHEIWHKPTRTIYVITSGVEKPLESRRDKLDLSGFYPVPRPAFDNLKSKELTPKPDYQFIETLIIELNRLQGRRAGLLKHIKAVRVYDAKVSDVVSALENAEDGANIPVTNLLEILESVNGSAGFDRIIADLPMADRVAVLRELNAQIEDVKNQIWEITGISDIIRGSTDPRETKGAQQLKGQWANVRLNDKTGEVNRLWRDVIRMMAEIICEHFDPQQLMLMTGIEVTPGMLQMMHSDIGRTFAIDIETDSTILKDDQEERQQKLELVNTILEKLNVLVPAVQSNAIPMDFAVEILLFAVSQYKNAKQLEDAIMSLGQNSGGLQALQQQLQQAQEQLQQGQQAFMQMQEQAAQAQQAAGQQIQQLQGELAKFSERDERRKDVETRGKFLTVQADSRKKTAEARAQEIENDILGPQLLAEVDKTIAETHRIERPDPPMAARGFHDG